MSDPFDDEGFFLNIDISALDACEAQAIQATQAAKPATREHGNTARYHHTVASPRPELLKEPRPLNTEPRAGGKSTFGFGEGGKHSHPANEIRLVENVRKRKEYWGLRRDDDEEDYDRPALTVDPTGRYGLLTEENDEDGDGDDDVVDLHAPGARTHALTAKGSFARPVDLGSQGALARRAAITEASRSAFEIDLARPSSKQAQSRGQNGDTEFTAPRLSTMAGSSRVLSRSVSVGSHVLAKTRQGAPRALSPVLSQSSVNPLPSSQGSQLRRSALELEDQRRQREGLEAKIKQLNDELAVSKTAPRQWADGLPVQVAGTVVSEERIKSLQTDLWMAKGEAETLRRAQKEDSSRHVAETERLRQQISQMQAAIADKERENVVRIENVKSQAIFATHAAFNSTAKAKARSRAPNRQATPTKSQNGSPVQRINSTGTTGPQFNALTRQDRPSVAQPMFGKLHNGFSTTVKVKKAEVDTSRPPGDDTENTVASPARDDFDDGNWGRDSENPFLHVDATSTTEQCHTLQARYIEHVLNYAHTSRLESTSSRRPSLYRIMSFRPREREAEYATCCSHLLEACANQGTTVARTNASIATILASIYTAIIDSTALPLAADNTSLLLDILGLLSSSLFIFPEMMDGDLGQLLSVATRRLVEKTIAPRAHTSLELDYSQRILETHLAHDIVRLCEGLCWLTDLRIWAGDDLAYVITTLLSPLQPHRVVERAIDLLRASSCTGLNLRAITASSTAASSDTRDVPIVLPVIERASRYLMSPHPDWTDEMALHAQMSIIRAIGCLCLEEADATLLLAQQSSLIPGIIVLLHRHSAKILGVDYRSHASMRVIRLLASALYLLHHLVFPSPLRCRPRTQKPVSSSHRYLLATSLNRDLAANAPQGVDLQARLLSASTVKEWSGLQHMFVSALGSLAYCEFIGQPSPDDESESEMEVEWRTLQYISQDLLESVVEGPEADEIYEMYFTGIETTSSIKEAGRKDVNDETDDETDEDGYAAMRDVVMIE